MPFNLRGPELLVLLLLVSLVAGAALLIVWLVKTVSKPPLTPAVPRDTERPAGWYPVPDGSGRVAW